MDNKYRHKILEYGVIRYQKKSSKKPTKTLDLIYANIPRRFLFLCLQSMRSKTNLLFSKNLSPYHIIIIEYHRLYYKGDVNGKGIGITENI